MEATGVQKPFVLVFGTTVISEWGTYDDAWCAYCELRNDDPYYELELEILLRTPTGDLTSEY